MKNFQKFIISVERPKSKFWPTNILMFMPRTYPESFRMIPQKMEEEVNFEAILSFRFTFCFSFWLFKQICICILKKMRIIRNIPISSFVPLINLVSFVEFAIEEKENFYQYQFEYQFITMQLWDSATLSYAIENCALNGIRYSKALTFEFDLR